MKNYPLWVCFFFSAVAHAQVMDNFSDGDFTSKPAWNGTAAQFRINTTGQLQLNASVAGFSWLSTPLAISPSGEIRWRTSVRQGFSGSGSNYGRVYLSSDESDLTAPLHGYYLQFGEPGANDAVTLYRQDGTTSTSLCRRAAGSIASSFSLRFEVTRARQGQWNVAIDYADGTDFIQESTAMDSTYAISGFLGVLCVYTTSNASKFYYDDFYAGTTSVSKAPVVVPAFKNIIITEILADPVPVVALPAYEFIEIYNRRDSSIDLTGWTISDGTTTGMFPSSSISSGEYKIVVSATDTVAFGGYRGVIAVAGFPSLNNDGDDVILKTVKRLTIDSVRYSSSWYRDADKQQGGWSLELIDPANPCGEGDNWAVSEDPAGGTPGRQNSVNASKPDVTGPQLISVTAGRKNVLLHFDEKLDRLANTSGQFFITPPVKIISVTFDDQAMTTIRIVLDSSLEKSTDYVVNVEHVTDCNGNEIQETHHELHFTLPEPADSLDILINEILFNPRPSGVDFVEVFNNSRKYISLNNWKLANFEDGRITGVAVITSSDVVMPPQTYLCFTSDSILLRNNYPLGREQNFFVTHLPSLPDDAGSIALVSDQDSVIDLFLYSKNFHSALIKDDEGVSLERISVADPTTDPQNWTSASSRTGYATPGYINSSSRKPGVVPPGEVVVQPSVFEPGSGFARISYQFLTPGLIANLKILDLQGRLIRTLGDNEVLDTAGFFRWDGDRDDGQRARMGYYIVWFEVIDLRGAVTAYRKRVVIASH